MGTVLPTRLSASAYQALRDCPYRFFTHYGLRLREVEELALPPGARDFGNWIHRTLAAFHVGGGQLSHSSPLVTGMFPVLQTCIKCLAMRLNLTSPLAPGTFPES